MLFEGHFFHFFVISLLLNLGLASCNFLKFSLGVDKRRGPQNIHRTEALRGGGLAVFTVFSIQMFSSGNLWATTFLPLLVAATPIFLLGLMEDLTGRVGAKPRLYISFVSGLIFCFLSGYSIKNTGFEYTNLLISSSFISIALTALAIATMSNAFNILDGLNGLSVGTGLIILFSFFYVSLSAQDIELYLCSVALMSVLSGFWLCNFFLGRIFLGDGGAYFLGAVIAGMAIMVSERSSTLSPFFCLAVVIFPFYEVTRSTVRRALADWSSIMEPDLLHLHSLIFRVVSKKPVFSLAAGNSLSSFITLVFPVTTCSFAISFRENQSALIVGIILFVSIYETSVYVLRRVTP